MKIPLVDLQAQYHSIKDEINHAVLDVIGRSNFVLGEDLERFEQDFAKYIGTKYSVGVNSGTGALFFALKALNIGVGDEVLTVSNSFIATYEAIAQSGATCKFVDINKDSYLIEINKIEEGISDKTRCIIPVHLYGAPCQIDEICEIAKKHNLFVIEDACQAHGAVYKGRKVGNWGDIGCFSFYPGKNLGCYGDGGAITTNSQDVMQRIKLLRNHGQVIKYNHEILGYNDRLDNLQAAVLNVKLKYLDEWNKKRSEIAFNYKQRLEMYCQTQRIHPESESVYHLFTIRHEKRDLLLNFLQENGIGSGLHYPIPIHKQPAYPINPDQTASLHETERHCQTTLSLPIYPELKIELQEFISEKVIHAISNLDETK